jgi:hypothetical protein
MLKQEDLDEIFTYHDPDPETQVPKYERIREEARRFAMTVLDLCPASAEATLAIRHVQQAVMFANAAIAIHTEDT